MRVNAKCMTGSVNAVSRRHCLCATAAAALGGSLWPDIASGETDERSADKALIGITLDLEMSRNFPTWESTHWDYEKGNLNDQTKEYATEAARRVKAAGGVLHFFVVGRVFEQADITWLQDLAGEGHPTGNHTYDHINVTATKPQDLQFRFQRAPWLLRDQSLSEAMRENVRLCEIAIQQRLGKDPDGFRTPGGFRRGLHDHPEVRAMLLELGYRWVSSLYPAHPYTQPREEPDEDVLEGILAAHQAAQPFSYADGLVEIPMSPISDIGAFRTGRWELDWYLNAIRRCMRWTIEQRAGLRLLGASVLPLRRRS